MVTEVLGRTVAFPPLTTLSIPVAVSSTAVQLDARPATTTGRPQPTQSQHSALTLHERPHTHTHAICGDGWNEGGGGGDGGDGVCGGGWGLYFRSLGPSDL